MLVPRDLAELHSARLHGDSSRQAVKPGISSQLQLQTREAIHGGSQCLSESYPGSPRPPVPTNHRPNILRVVIVNCNCRGPCYQASYNSYLGEGPGRRQLNL